MSRHAGFEAKAEPFASIASDIKITAMDTPMSAKQPRFKRSSIMLRMFLFDLGIVRHTNPYTKGRLGGLFEIILENSRR